jgi:hypothetical protein
VDELGRRRTAARVLVALAAPALLWGCSDNDPESTPTVADSLPGECQARSPILRVDLIDQAVALVEQELGGPQQYFEINATGLLVNLFVAIEDGTQVKPFVFLQNELNSRDPQPAEGNTFVASALDFDPQRVMSCVADELPESTATAFEIIGSADGAVSYSVVLDSASGGQLVVSVSSAGQVLSVDPV